MTNTPKNIIRNFLEEDPFYQESITKGFSDDLPLVETGAIDSIGIFNLIVFLETQFHITIAIEELSDSNFLTLNHIEKFIQEKVRQANDD